MDIKNVHAVFRPNQSGLKQVLGDLESEVMETFWAEGKAMLVKDIHPRLPLGKSLTYSTIVCTTTALAEKGLLREVARVGKARVYLPEMGREEFLHRALGHVIDNILAAFPDTAAALLNERLTPERAKRLHGYLAAIEAEAGS